MKIYVVHSSNRSGHRVELLHKAIARKGIEFTNVILLVTAIISGIIAGFSAMGLDDLEHFEKVYWVCLISFIITFVSIFLRKYLNER